MAEFIQTPGFELPILAPGTAVARSKPQIKKMVDTGPASIVRSVRIKTTGRLYPRLPSLLNLIEIVDEQFEIVAENCEARVVPHTYGLEKLAPTLQPPYHPLLPEGYGLVAEVDVIQDRTELQTSETLAVTHGLLSYWQEHGPYIWGDGSHRQFMNGRLRDGPRQRYLLDIEPRVYTIG